MRRLPIALTALLLGAASAPQAFAASVDQNGDYLYTFTQNDGVSTYTRTRHLNQRQMERYSARAAQSLPRFQDIGRDCSSGGSYANRATLDQSGLRNTAWFSQTGSNDTASVSQTGEDNGSYTLQSGNGRQSSTSQVGNNNLSVNVQTCRSVRSVVLGRFLDLYFH